MPAAGCYEVPAGVLEANERLSSAPPESSRRGPAPRRAPHSLTIHTTPGFTTNGFICSWPRSAAHQRCPGTRRIHPGGSPAPTDALAMTTDGRITDARPSVRIVERRVLDRRLRQRVPRVTCSRIKARSLTLSFTPSAIHVPVAATPRQYGDLSARTSVVAVCRVDLARRSVDRAGFVRFVVISEPSAQHRTDAFVRMFMDEARINAELQHGTSRRSTTSESVTANGTWRWSTCPVSTPPPTKAVSEQKEEARCFPRVTLASCTTCSQHCNTPTTGSTPWSNACASFTAT